MKTKYKNFESFKKRKNIFKQSLSLFMCAIISFSIFLFSGCESIFEDVGNGILIEKSFFEQYVDGFNVVYADKEDGSYSGITEEQNQLSNFLGIFQDGLIYNYGSGYNEYNDNRYEIPETKNHAPFTDSIRMLVTATETGTAETDLTRRWNWLINPFANPTTTILNPNSESYIFKDEIDSKKYINWKTFVLEYIIINNFSDSYSFSTFSEIFQIVLYEIMLGYEPTTLEVVSGEEKTINNGDSSYKLSCNYYQVKIENCPTDPSLNGKYIYNYVEGAQLEITENGIVKEYSIKAENTTEPDPAILDYLEVVKAIYQETTRYTGLTKQNADKLINYVLDEIIGSDLVAYDYNKYKESINYRNYVSTIAYLIYKQTYDGSGDDWVYEYNNPEEGINLSYTFSGTYTNENGETVTVDSGFYSSKAATYLQYFEGERFFGSFDGKDQFTDIAPYSEYQSVVVIPAISAQTIKDGGLELEAGFVYNFMSKNRDLRIRATVRYYYYDKETQTGQLYEFEMEEINFTDGANTFVNKYGETCYENDFKMTIDVKDLDPSIVETRIDKTGYRMTSYTVDFFDERYVFEDVGEINLTQNETIQSMYKVMPSQNGFGSVTILDEKKIQSSFFEIALDVVKSPNDPEDTDYRFSMVLSNTLLYPGIW